VGIPFALYFIAFGRASEIEQ
jgi:hypothetical protein